jgi:glycosyltransferase involved in cell wall biosynthesis
LIQHISILICTYNGRQKLHDTLAHIAALQVPSILLGVELLLVDNHSQDGTAAFAQERWNQLGAPFALHIIHEQKSGKAHALTTGYNAAKGDIIVLCDDDNWLQKDYLVHVKNLFDIRPEIGLAGGFGSMALFHNDEKPEWFDTFSRYFVVGTHHPHSRILAKGDYSVYGAGSVLRKTVWNKIYSSGFRFQNSTYKGRAFSEDVELSMAVSFSGYKLYFDEQLTFIHDLRWGRLTFENLVEQERLNGKGHLYLHVYEILYYRIRSKFIFPRFLKEYLLLGKSWFKEIVHMRKHYVTNKDLQTHVEMVKKASMIKYMVFLFPVILFKFNFFKHWIFTVSVEK